MTSGGDDARFTDGGPALTADDLRAAERAVGVRFPREIVALYESTNGGVPVDPHWTNDDDVDTLINEFLPIRHAADETQTLEGTYRRMTQRGVLDADLVPFAVDDGGNFFCFDADGAIHFVATDAWQNGLSPEENRARTRTRVADSLYTFLERLGPEPE